MSNFLTNTPGTNHGAVSQLLCGFDQLPDSAHVSIRIVCAIFGCSPATAWRRVRSGHLVQPVRFSPGSTRWQVGALRRSLNAMSCVKGSK
jgi:predicted DNA-binding transcriptional regulator AlpA